MRLTGIRMWDENKDEIKKIIKAILPEKFPKI